jgi:hypothetical protein|tara:strand:+ start:676 stop:921 length:246 start_codon:yes stop_codon:yes gene_type:complete
MAEELKNFTSGKDWWHMDRTKAVHLVELISEMYQSKLNNAIVSDENLELYEEIENDLANLSYQLQTNPEEVFEKVGIKLEK